MRDLEQAERAGDKRAELALQVFAYRARKYVGAYLAAMSGGDAIAFTGGIGENSPAVRAAICEGLSWFGIKFDAERNAAHAPAREGRISADSSRVAVYVIPTNEELLIARGTAGLISDAVVAVALIEAAIGWNRVAKMVCFALESGTNQSYHSVSQ